MNLAEMRAERARLNAAIDAAEKEERTSWNVALDACEDALAAWLRWRKIEVERRGRKNEKIWNVGHGALTVTFGYDEPDYAHSLRMVSGRDGTLTLEWSEVPAPDRLIAIVAALLGETAILSEGWREAAP